MTTTRSFQQNQIEVGILEHNGTEYAAYGATVVRRDITAYLKFKKNHYWLSSWSGGAKLDCRSSRAIAPCWVIWYEWGDAIR